jgi:hypothetical protein
MSLFPFSTSDRKDAEIPVAAATSLSDRERSFRAERSAGPRPLGASTIVMASNPISPFGV